MFDKLRSGIDVFRKGSEVTNVEMWKSHQITGTMLGGFFIAVVNLAAAFGYPLPIDLEAANAIGAGLVAVANVLLTAATSKRAGILPAKGPVSEGDSVSYDAVSVVDQAPATADAPLQPVRRAANGDILDGLDTTFRG